MQVVRLDHDKVNLVYTSDWHASDVPPGKRTSAYREQIMAKGEFVADLATKLRGVSVHGGDVYHFKHPRHAGNSHALQVRLETTLRRTPCKRTYGRHGNHDLLADRIESIPSQPIGS